MTLADECETCKKRRVKCDGVKPNCGRCAKASRMCIFPDVTEKSFTFVSNVNHPTKSLKRGRGENQDNPVKRHRVALNAIQQWKPTPAKAITPSLADQATAFYFHSHHSGFPDLIEPAQEHADLLPKAFARTTSQSALHSALLARSHAAFGKRKQDASLAAVSNKEATRMYVNAIGMIKQSLLDPIDAASDEILLAAMVLSSFESTLSMSTDENGFAPSFELSRRMMQGFHHHDGAAAILRLRKQQPAKAADLNLDKLVRRQVLRSALVRGSSIPSFLEYGEYFGESGVMLGLDRHMAQLIKGQRYATLIRKHYAVARDGGKPLNGEPLSMLIHGLQRLDNDMLAWAQKLPSDWWYERHQTTHHPSSAYYPSGSVHSYNSVGHVAVWNRHRAVRIIVKKVAIEYLRIAEEFFGDECELPIRTISGGIKDLINDICASSELNALASRKTGPTPPKVGTEVQQFLNATMLAHLAFPLHAIIDALPLAGMSNAQEQWIRDRLLEVGKSGNDTILEQLALQGNSSRLERSTTPD